jgi:hypothetical protein
MTGGVAHDFNNLLTIIMGGPGYLRRLLAGEPAFSGIGVVAAFRIALEKGVGVLCGHLHRFVFRVFP